MKKGLKNKEIKKIENNEFKFLLNKCHSISKY